MPSVRSTLRLTPLAFAILGVAACSSSAPTAPATYAVRYDLFVSGEVHIDSIRYDDGHGTLTRVAAPTTDWTMVLTVATGGTVQASAWGLASTPASIKLKATWTRSGVSSAADSGLAVTSAPGHFVVELPQHTL